ncbi:MAG: helix-turn-helix transcriptional regulator [Pseudomonadota bacterium]
MINMKRDAVGRQSNEIVAATDQSSMEQAGERKKKALSGMETDCLQLMANGKSYQEISEKYELSELTIRYVVLNACSKLNAGNVPHATKIALESGLIEI